MGSSCNRDRSREIFLVYLEKKADELGPFAHLEELELLLCQVPEKYRDSFIYGYIKGTYDTRCALGD